MGLFFLIFLVTLLFVLLIAVYYLPLSFHLHFAYGKDGVEFRLGFSALKGWIHREHEFFTPGALTGSVQEEYEADGPLLDGEERKTSRLSAAGLWRRIQEVQKRLVQWGLGGTLLSYFIPQKYSLWLKVADRIEHKGRFTNLDWETRAGLGEPDATALAAGLLWSGKAYLLALAAGRFGLNARRTRLSVLPSFTGVEFATRLDCIYTFRAGQIICAGVCGYLSDKLRRSVSRRDE